jgi:hypothetical protein
MKNPPVSHPRSWCKDSPDEYLATLYRYHYHEKGALLNELSNRGYSFAYLHNKPNTTIRIMKSVTTTKEI